MKKEQLQNFVEIVQTGSINKASENLYITQPSLSRSMKALEEEMGKKLFIRTSRGVKLTLTGKIFYNYAQSILSQFQVLERLRNLDEEIIFSQLSVSVASIFLKDDIILNFYQRMRSSETEIKFMETTAEYVMDHVVEGVSEIGIVVLNNHQLKIFKRMAELKELELTVFGDSPLYVHTYEKNELAAKHTIHAEDLLSHIYIHLPYDFIANLNLSLEVEHLKLSDLGKTITMSNYHAIIHMLHHTDSFMLGHKWQIEELSASHIHSFPLADSDAISKYLIIVKRKRDILSPAAAVFLDLFHEAYDI